MKRILLLTALGLSACKGAAADPMAALSVQRGEALYAKYCASCHNTGGLAQSLSDDIWQYGESDADILRAISVGIEDAGMPAFGDTLSAADKADLLTFIRRGQDLKTTPAIVDVPSLESRVQIQDWATGLDQPWGLHFIGSNEALVTEKSGKLWRVSSSEKQQITGIPASVEKGQGGLLDVAIDPDYANNGWVYLSFTHADATSPRKLMTKIVRGKIVGNGWAQEQTLFQAKAEHYLNSGQHFGARITFDNQGHLYFGIGDRGQKEMAQDVTRPNGKIHRILHDGSIPKDNPFLGNPEAYPTIFSYGNRNPQGTIVHPKTQIIWETEHGPRGGDELNVIRAGVNYGWPKISYGRNYSGTELTPYTALPGMAQPASQWTPSIAVCGLDVYTGDLFPNWKGRLMAGSLRNQTLRLIDVDGEDYLSEAIVLKDKGRVRDVTTGPDGAIYVALPNRIIRLSPASE